MAMIRWHSAIAAASYTLPYQVRLTRKHVHENFHYVEQTLAHDLVGSAHDIT